MKAIAGFLLAASLSGCVGLAPAMAGKTHYNVEFTDTTLDQNTQYKMNIKAPAGVDLASVTGMTYDWQPDGSGNISVSNDSTVNTQAQAEALVKINEQQTMILGETVKALTSALEMLKNED